MTDIKLKNKLKINNKVNIIENIENTVNIIDNVEHVVNMINNIDLDKDNKNKPIINRGTKAGGKNTNINGLNFEKETSCKNILEEEGYNDFSKNLFKQFINKKKIYSVIDGCKSPDECYINEDKKHIIIIEKKFQNKNGSVCEKIQTAPFKKLYFEKILPLYKITYAYILSKWFETNCKVVIEMLQKDYKIPILIVNDKFIDKNFIKELAK